MQYQDGPMKGYFAWSLNPDGTHRAEGPASDGTLMANYNLMLNGSTTVHSGMATLKYKF